MVLVGMTALPALPSGAATEGGGTDVSTILVRFRGATSAHARAAAHVRVGGRPVGRVHGLPVSVVRVPAGASADELVARYERLQGVAWAEPNAVVRAAGAPLPDDPSFDRQYGLHNVGQEGGTIDADIAAPEGWAAAGMSVPGWATGGGAPIGVVDSGIDASHIEFAGRIAGCVHSLEGDGDLTPGCNDGFGHGTHVTGIAAAAADNGAGVAGVSFTSPVLVCRALNNRGLGWTSDVAGCVTWLHEHGARVINLSIVEAGGQTMQAAVQEAWDGGSASGAVVVAAAGNSRGTGCEYPACFAEVVSVAATDRFDGHPTFSTRNADVELAAPGVSIYSTLPGGYGFLTGTSMASPHAAGVAAVVWQEHPTLTAQQVRDRLQASSDDLGDPGRDVVFGFGRVNLCGAVSASCGGGGGAGGEIYGTVVDQDGDPVRARVRVIAGPQEAADRAGSDGSYALPDLVAGDYRLRAGKAGCTKEVASVSLGPQEAEELDFVLTC